MAQLANPLLKSTNTKYRYAHGQRFVSWLPHLPSSSLLLAWEISRGWNYFLGPCTNVGYLDEAPGSRLHLGLAVVIAVICRVKHSMEGLYLSLSGLDSANLPFK